MSLEMNHSFLYYNFSSPSANAAYSPHYSLLKPRTDTSTAHTRDTVPL